MKKGMSRVIAWLLTLCMGIQACDPAVCFAEEEIFDDGITWEDCASEDEEIILVNTSDENVVSETDEYIIDEAELDVASLQADILAPEFSSVTAYTSGIVIKWNYVSGWTGVHLYRMAENETEWTKLTDTTALAYVDTNTEGGVRYCYAVETYIDTEGGSEEVSEKTVSEMVAAYPSAPVITGLSTTDGKVTVTWEEVAGADSYTVYRQQTDASTWVQVGTVSDATEYTDTTASGASTYTYAVRATSKDSDGNSLNSAWGFTDLTVTPDVATSAVDTVTVSAYTSGIVVKWSAASGDTGYAAGYILYRKSYDSEEWTKLTDTDSTTYIDTDTEGGATYIYGVSAYFVSNGITAYSEKTESKEVVAYPESPVITGLSTTDGKVTVTWEEVAGADSYTVYRQQTDTSTWVQVGTVSDATEYTDTTVSGASTYTYAVRATSKDSDGNSLNSAWGFTDLTVTPDVVALSVTEVTATSYTSGVVVKWDAAYNDNGYASGYYLYRRMKGQEGWEKLIDTEDLGYTDTDLVGGEKYEYAVEAYILTGELLTTGDKICSELVVAYPMKPALELVECTENYIEVEWSEVKGAEKYILYRRLSDDETWKEISTFECDVLSYKDASALTNCEYVYAVKAVAYDEDGNMLESEFGICPDIAQVEENNGIYNVTDTGFDADGTDTEDDTSSIQKALDKAQNASPDDKVTVYVPNGTYYISSALMIYPNTILQLESSAVIVRSDLSKMMLYSVHLNDEGEICMGTACTHGGYSQAVNITVKGGCWDGGVSAGDTESAAANLFSFAHAANLTIENTTLENACGDHMINIDAVSGLNVSGVTFRNFYKYTGTDSAYFGEGMTEDGFDYYGKEALHIDYISEGSSTSASPLDRLACKNIRVKGCVFDNCVSGVGTHNVFEDLYTSQVSITENTFSSICCNAINTANFTELTVTDNTVDKTNKFLLAEGSSGSVTNNVVSNIELYGIEALGSALDISGNSFVFQATDTDTNIGIYLEEVGSSTVNNNSVSGDMYMGIYVQNFTGDKLLIQENTVSGADYGIFISKSEQGIEILQNTVKNAQVSGIYSASSTKITIDQNSVSESQGNGIEITDDTGSVVTNNEIDTAQNTGIMLTNSKNVTVKGNTINSCQKYGIAGTDCEDISICNNTVMDNEIYDIAVTGTSTGSVFENNISKTGVYTVDGVSEYSNGRSLAYCSVTSVGAQYYTGEEIKPDVTIKSGKETLEKGVDYCLSYKDNIEIGTATIVITGQGTFSDEVEIEFNIVLGVANIVSLENTSAGIVVTWNECKGADYYNLYRKALGGSWTQVASSIGDNSYTDSKVSYGTEYTYAIKAYRKVDDGVINGAWSATELTIVAQKIIVAPEKPVIDSLTSTESGVIITWENVSGANYYTIYRSVKGSGSWSTVATNVIGESYTDRTVKAGVTYTYAMKAHNNEGSSVLTSGWSATTLSVTAQELVITPEKPVIKSLTATSDGVKVAWGSVIGANYYTLYRSVKDSTSWSVIATNITGTSYTDASVKAGVTYTYAMKAHNNKGSSVLTSGWSATTLSVTAQELVITPEKPVIKSLTATSGGVKVTWGSVTGANYYTLYRSVKESSSWSVVATNITGTSYTDADVKAGVTYTYAMKAHNNEGESVLTSGWSATTLSVTAQELVITPEKPVIKSLTSTDDGVVVIWGAVTGANYYTLYRSVKGSNTWNTVATNITGTTFTDDSVKAGVTYTYAMKASNNAGTSVLTSGWSATTLSVTVE